MSSEAPRGGVFPTSVRVMNLAYFLTRNARRFPDRLGLALGDQQWTWSQTDRAVSALAVALSKRGVMKGDRVLVQSKNCAEMFFSMYAAFRLGAVWVPVNYRLLPHEVADLAVFSGATAFLCHAHFAEHASAVVQSHTGLRFLWCMTDGDFGESSVASQIASHDGAHAENVAVDRDDPCWFLFTSGTTGRSKASVLTHGQMAFVVNNHLCDLMPATSSEDVSLVIAPLSHGAGVHQLVQTSVGAASVLIASDHFDAKEIFNLIETYRITNCFTVPTILKKLAEYPSIEDADHSSLRYVIYAGAPIHREDQKFALRKLGHVLVQYYGLGEVTGNITALPAAFHSAEDGEGVRIGTCGFERTGIQVSIQNEAGEELAPFEVGEVCAIGPAVIVGYYNNPDANERAFRNGFFRTGDYGYMDTEGFLFLTGRASDMYISGGYNIYPFEIEDVLLTHPDVAEVAVLGTPDDVWGEVGTAVCVLVDGVAEEPDLSEYLSSKIPRFKIPKHFFFWKELPKSGYGKVTKRTIYDELVARGTLDIARAKVGRAS